MISQIFVNGSVILAYFLAAATAVVTVAVCFCPNLCTIPFLPPDPVSSSGTVCGCGVNDFPLPLCKNIAAVSYGSKWWPSEGMILIEKANQKEVDKPPGALFVKGRADGYGVLSFLQLTPILLSHDAMRSFVTFIIFIYGKV